MTSFTPNREKNKAIVVAGPTASGKSALAIRLAQAANGVVINADSMQVYRDAPTLTARPTVEDERKVPHRLYGFLEPDESFSVFKWVRAAAAEMRAAWAAGKIPVVVGGTGLYLQTLINGMSPVPQADAAVRQSVRDECERLGFDAFLADFQRKDPDFSFTDPQRVLRAAEVLAQTGKSVTYWQRLPFEKAVDADFHDILVNPDRAELYARCDKRFDLMMQSAAENEVRALLAKNPPADSLIMKAVGVAEITAFLNGEATMDQAVARARQATRNYAKRQITWFRHRFRADTVVSDAESNDALTDALHFLS